MTATIQASDPVDPTAADRSAYRYQPGLDGLRALSVLAVIAYHNGYSWAVGGFLGVDAFFVLSGFLITTLLVLEYRRAESVGLVAFWGRRLRRLAPALLLVLVFAGVYGAVLLRPYELGRLRWDSISSLFYVTNWRFIASGQSYFDLFATPSPLRHLWSLAIEEQFYLVWPVVVLVCMRVRKGSTDLLAAVCVVGGGASVVAMHVLYDPLQPSRAYYGTDARVHTILVGALLSLVILRWPPRGRVSTMALPAAGAAVLIALGWSWHVVDATDSGYYGVGSLMYAVGVAVVVAAAVQPGLMSRALGIAPLRGIGRISYGLYLWHWPIIVWLVHWRVGFGDSRLVAVRLAVTFAAAILSYRFVEQPIRHGRWFGPTSSARLVAFPVGITVVAAILVGSTLGATDPPSYFRGGFPIACPTPTPSEVREATQAARALPVGAVRGPYPTIAVIGDSVSCSLASGFRALQRVDDVKFRMGGAIACGEASNQVLASENVDLVPADTDKCEELIAGLRRSATAGDVPVALWVSSWERADLDDDGTRVRAGSAAWKGLLLRRTDRIIAELQRAGVHVVMVTMPPKAPGEVGGQTPTASERDGETYRALNDLLVQIAARHPADVTLLDLAEHVCPGGAPCPREVDGFAPRAIDGGHFTPRGSVWALEWLLPQIRDAERRAHSGA